MNMDEEFSILWKFYFMDSVSAFTTLTTPILIIYLIAVNMSTSLIGLLFGLVALFIVLFEIPTGVVADVFGRKLSVIISIFLDTIAAFMMFLSTNHFIIGAALLIGAIAYTFLSGALYSWFVDYYLHKGDKKYLNRVISRKESIFSFMSFFAYCSSSIILIILKPSYGFINVVRFMYLIETVILILLAIIAISTKEPYFKRKKIKNYFRDSFKNAKITFKKSIVEIKKSKKLLYIFFGSMVFFFASTSLSTEWIQFKNNGIDESMNGFLYGGMYLLSGITLMLNEKLTKKGSFKLIILSLIVLSVSTFLMGLNIGLWLIPVFLINAGIFWNLLFNNLNIEINKLIQKKIRATVLSMKSVSDQIPTMLGDFLLFGLVSDLFSINITLFAGGIIMLSSLLIFLRLDKV
ncbi:MAG: MFS transporter [Candidatus Nanoarchaeia archaeon]|jgi:MFS family permease